MINKKISTLAFVFMGLTVSAQDVSVANPGASNLLDYLYNNLFFVLSGLVLLGIFYAVMKLITTMMDLQKIRLMEEQGIEALEKANMLDEKSTFEKFYDWLWSIVPVKEERAIDLGHDYDGIRELDNRLPPWWLLLFYGTIIFGAVYMYYYHWSGREWSSVKEYAMAMEEAEIQKARFLDKMANAVNENNVEALTDQASLAEGESIFKTNCVACHGNFGEGTVGPNLTDQYWIHGGGIKNVFKTIKYGVPEKGMISWKTQLRPAAMQKVASYILTLQGTNPPNPKAKEGDLYVPEEAPMVEEVGAVTK